jgi:dTDP-glucose 4,6-dehydratase
MDFANEIIKLTKTDQKIIHKDLPEGDPAMRRPDISKAREILGWEPAVNRADGLKITYEYFQGLTKDELYKKEHKSFDAFFR